MLRVSNSGLIHHICSDLDTKRMIAPFMRLGLWGDCSFIWWVAKHLQMLSVLMCCQGASFTPRAAHVRAHDVIKTTGCVRPEKHSCWFYLSPTWESIEFDRQMCLDSISLQTYSPSLLLPTVLLLRPFDLNTDWSFQQRDDFSEQIRDFTET